MATTANRGKNSGLKHHKLTTLTRDYPIATFFVTTYALSWTYWVAVLGLANHQGVLWMAAPGGFGPATAGLLVTGVLSGRAGVRGYLRRIVLWRVNVGWYLAALLGPPALLLAGVAAFFGTHRLVDVPP